MTIKARIKTLEELLSTPGVNFNEGVLRCKGGFGSLHSCMFIYCGKEMEGFSTESGGLVTSGGEYIEKWMCSEWEDLHLQSQLDDFQSEKILLDGGNYIKVDINQERVEDFIARDENIFLRTDSCCLGVSFKEWEAINNKVNEIIKLKENLLKESK